MQIYPMKKKKMMNKKNYKNIYNINIIIIFIFLNNKIKNNKSYIFLFCLILFKAILYSFTWLCKAETIC